MFMGYKRGKKRSTKILIGLLLVSIIALASIAIAYVVINAYASQKPRGLHVGDVFTYNITASSYLITQDAVSPAYLAEYNMTDYYQVSITSVNGASIGFNTLWKFTNGTSVADTESINLDTGSSTGGFWAIYLPGLNEGNQLNPQANNGLIVNSTSTQTYATSTGQQITGQHRTYLPILAIQQVAHSNKTTLASVSMNQQECSPA